MMKFVVNHPWKFRYVFSAFMIGFFKVLIASLVELLNIFVLCSNTEVMEILYNFIALCVVIEFNDMFAGVLQDDFCFKLLQNQEDEEFRARKGLLIQTTTSRYADKRKTKNSFIAVHDSDYDEDDD